jgi:DNA-binding transcriptional LysR family regulator
MTVDLRQLRQFVAVAEELSFRNAATRLNMSQPPLSSAIRQLEEDLGRKLLERNNRNVRLTQVGDVFLREARRTIAQAEHAIAMARRAGDGVAGSLRITFVPTASLSVLPQLVKEFRNRYPEADVRLEADTTGTQLLALDKGRSDIALIVVPLQNRSNIRLTPFRRERMLIALPQDHRFANAESIELKELAEEEFLAFPFSEGPGFNSIFMTACQRAGFSPTIKQEVSQMLTKIMLVATGLGIGLVPEPMTAVPMPNVVFRPITDKGEQMTFDMAFAVSTSNDNLLVDRFLETAKEFSNH